MTSTRVESTADLVNSGTMVLRSSTLTATSYTQTAGSTRLQARSRITADTHIIGGSFGVNGFVDGDLTLGPGAITRVQVRPVGPLWLTVSGKATLGGTLSVNTTDGTQLDLTQARRFLKAGSRQGEYDSREGNVPAYAVEYRTDGALLVHQ